MREKNSQRTENCLECGKDCAGHKRFARIVAGIVAFCIVGTLSVPALAVDTTDLLCELDHEHDQSCYSVEETEKVQDLTEIILHTHNEFCYDREENLICPLPEREAHVHSDDCYEITAQETESTEQAHLHSSECYTRARGKRICTMEEPVTHVHTDACYELIEQNETFENAHIHTAECYVRQRGDLTCVLPEYAGHIHEDGCYIPGELICIVEESEAHTHENSCYDKVLCCVIQENAGHAHADACYEWSTVCVCGFEEKTFEPKKVLVCTEGTQLPHVHGDACYGAGKELICDKNEAHIHTDHCYEWTQVLSCGKEELSAAESAKVLICSKTELVKHIHADSCYEADSAGAVDLICDQYQIDEHQHTESCLAFSADRLLCEQEESDMHKHDYTCYSSWTFLCQKTEEPDPVPEEKPVEETVKNSGSDPSADNETAKQWEKTFAHVELTGAWSHDLLAIAQTQLGYEESVRNFIISDSGEKKGYTRYGDWYGVEYGDWCAMFASFCLNYAEVEDFPLNCNCARWIEALIESEMYVEAGTCMPRPGDLLFIDYGRKSRDTRSVPDNADHVAIVAEVIPATQEEPARIVTIEGNYDDRVCYETRSLEDPKIMGYALLPDGPAATYSCGMEIHTHEADCYDEEDRVICQIAEHSHDEICRSKSLQFADDFIQVDITLTNAVYVPENLSLNVVLTAEDNASIRSEMMNDIERAMSERACAAAEIRSCQMELLVEGQPYQLPIGVQANVEISFAKPVFGGEHVSKAAEIYTFMQAEEIDMTTGKKKPYQLEMVFGAEYEHTADGMTGLSFAVDHISEFAVVLADSTQEIAP